MTIPERMLAKLRELDMDLDEAKRMYDIAILKAGTRIVPSDTVEEPMTLVSREHWHRLRKLAEEIQKDGPPKH